MAPPTKTHRKPDADRRDDRIPVRVTAVQKAMLAEGARRASVEVSTWLRQLGIERCRTLGITEENVTVPDAPSGQPGPTPPSSREPTAAPTETSAGPPSDHE
jgi:hypothetical protein